MNFNDAVENILFSKNDHGELKKGVDFLADFFFSKVATELNSTTVQTKYGRAIPTMDAAQCINDTIRTARFLRGIYQAISHRLGNQKKVNILYAGCGPFATLFTPLTAKFSPEQVSCTLADVNETSMSTVRNLYHELGLNRYIHEFLTIDLVAEDLSLSQLYDIIISETMQSGLKTECQVAITRNLTRFLSGSGVFIPECIEIEAYLLGGQRASGQEYPAGTSVGKIYELHYKHVPAMGYTVRFPLPVTNNDFLFLYTKVTIYQDAVIYPNESGLTIPLPIGKVDSSKGQYLDFTYDEGQLPDWKMMQLPLM